MSSVVLGIDEVRAVQGLITQLIDAGKAFARTPFVLSDSEKSSLMGEVFFRDGWALVQQPAVRRDR